MVDLPCLYVLHERLEFSIDTPIEFTKNVLIRQLNDQELAQLYRRIGDDGLQYHYVGFQRVGAAYVVDPNVKSNNPIYGLQVSNEANVHALIAAFMISVPRLIPCLEIRPSSVGFAPDHLHNVYQFNRTFNRKKKSITSETLKDIRNLYESISEQGENPYAPISLYEKSLSVPFGSEFWVIALCSILERSMVRAKERSIGDMIARKASYMQDYYGDSTDPRFTSGNKQEIWKKLYDWRSKFVHGGFADFSKNGEFKCLVSLDDAKSILDSGVREVLRIIAHDANQWSAFKEI